MKGMRGRHTCMDSVQDRGPSLEEGKDTNWAPLALFSGPCLA